MNLKTKNVTMFGMVPFLAVILFATATNCIGADVDGRGLTGDQYFCKLGEYRAAQSMTKTAFIPLREFSVEMTIDKLIPELRNEAYNKWKTYHEELLERMNRTFTIQRHLNASSYVIMLDKKLVEADLLSAEIPDGECRTNYLRQHEGVYELIDRHGDKTRIPCYEAFTPKKIDYTTDDFLDFLKQDGTVELIREVQLFCPACQNLESTKQCPVSGYYRIYPCKVTLIVVN